MKEEETEFLEFLTSLVEPKPDERACALCLAPIKRNQYQDHMKKHGYETLEVTPIVK